MRNWLRWFLVVPSMFLAWFLILQLFYGGIYLLGSYCAPDDFGPWICGESWYLIAAQCLFYLCFALCPFLIIVGAVFVAPFHKRTFAWITFFIGVGVGLYMADDGPVAQQDLCLFVGGILGLWVSLRWLTNARRRPEPKTATRSNGA